ncbi:HicB family protein (plasmid) [Rhizobium phaseoli]|nr:HicB family protein [Rhizobium phaseoli]ANL76315.1 HicB family protein [Rhizobium phaseoli]ANL82671.1 HicB family protein [Rhizobium phaseoli]
MNTMTYNGYHARIEFDAEDDVFFGKIAGISDVIGFHGDSVAELKKAFHEAVDDYLETCRKIGKEPQRPYSGKMMFRVAPEVHRRAALAAELSGKSLNQWAEEVLGEAADHYAEPRLPARERHGNKQGTRIESSRRVSEIGTFWSDGFVKQRQDY